MLTSRKQSLSTLAYIIPNKRMDSGEEGASAGATDKPTNPVQNESEAGGSQQVEVDVGEAEVAGNGEEPSGAGGADVAPTPGTSAAMDNLSTCLVCGRQDRSMEFILPGRYCSQSCADQNGSSEFGDTVKGKAKSAAANKTPNGGSGGVPGKRKKKRASYLSAYEENFRMDSVEDRKSSKAKKTKAFTWEKFLAAEKLVAAPEELFVGEPAAGFINPFSIGMKMEGIDLHHSTLYCVLTVAEVKGHRLRLHFDGYSDSYDFWTYAYSDQIFPVGWCEENGKKLLPPKGVAKDSFGWDKYLQLSKSTAAPRELFKVCSKEFRELVPAFLVGDRLEAVDIKNNNLVCVASVADTHGDKLLIHFDGWEDLYDYWCSYSSPYIHHIGWCQENVQVLSAPNGYVDAESFTWESYLEETNSRAAPREGFKNLGQIDTAGFECGMALEVVDRRNPSLVRVAEIIEVVDFKMLVHFSGWDNKYDYWEEVEHPDLHPVGWCSRTSHPLQPPLSPLDVLSYNGVCPTVGCYGYGHVKGAKYSGHHSVCGCPYSDMNLNKDNILLDRLASGKTPSDSAERKSSIASLSSTNLSQCNTPGCDGTGHVTGKFPTHFTISGCPLAEVNQNKMMKNLSVETASASGAKKREKRRRGSSTGGSRAKRNRRNTAELELMEVKAEVPTETPAIGALGVEQRPATYHRSAANQDMISPSMMMPPPPNKPSPQDILQTGIHNSVFLPALPSSHKHKPLPICWDRNIKLLPGISNIQFSQVPKWSCKRVSEFIKSIVPSLTSSQRKLFVEQEIDGDAFLLLTQSDITSILKLKLGPALKVYNSVLVIKKGLGQS